MSKSETSKQLLPKGRKQTDKSLVAERAKTDEAVSQGRNLTEHNTDEAVSTNRADADETRSQARLEADASSAANRAAPGGSRLGDRLESDELLRKERDIADDALATERRHVDSIIDVERKQKGIEEHGLFEAERSKTDVDLTNERSQTDIEVERATVELTTRDEFLAIVSHDLRNPLGSISMAAQILASSPLFLTANQEMREYLEIIERNAGEALRLIGDLMDMEQIASGKLGLHIEPNDIDDIIQHSVKSFQHLASGKRIALVYRSDNIGITVACDRDRISQVLSNIIGNAIKFTPSGGTVTLAFTRSEHGIQISIADTGPGIASDLHKTIFSRFWQIGKNDRRGLGLGLYISKMIVEAHFGKIWIDSKIGHGSVFCVTLPMSTKR